MHITLLTIGSRGDVQPCIALGMGLQAAGHHVRLATHANFETFARERGLDFFPVEGNPGEILETEAGRDILASGRNPLRFMRQLVRILEPLMEPSVVVSFFGDQSFWAERMAELGVGPRPIPRKHLSVADDG